MKNRLTTKLKLKLNNNTIENHFKQNEPTDKEKINESNRIETTQKLAIIPGGNQNDRYLLQPIKR
jgi:hypothetical protein